MFYCELNDRDKSLHSGLKWSNCAERLTFLSRPNWSGIYCALPGSEDARIRQRSRWRLPLHGVIVNEGAAFRKSQLVAVEGRFVADLGESVWCAKKGIFASGLRLECCDIYSVSARILQG